MMKNENAKRSIIVICIAVILSVFGIVYCVTANHEKMSVSNNEQTTMAEVAVHNKVDKTQEAGSDIETQQESESISMQESQAEQTELDSLEQRDAGASDVSSTNKQENVVSDASNVATVHQPVHHEAITHEEPIYEQVWVVDVAAYDEQVQGVEVIYCNTCGETFAKSPEYEQHINDSIYTDDTGIHLGCGGYHIAPSYTTVHHDEVGHYENKQVGTKIVVDKEAWDE